MNNFFNFTIPYFCSEYGADWDGFNTIVEDNTDYLFEKIWDFYKLNDPNFFSTRVAELVLQSLKIPFTELDTLQTKKQYIRKFLTNFKNKGSADIYLDVQESI